MKGMGIVSVSLLCSFVGPGVEAIASPGFTTLPSDACGDVNADGAVNVADAFVIARGQPLMCPVGGACDSGSDIVSLSWLVEDSGPEVTILNTWTNVSAQTVGVPGSTVNVSAQATGALCDTPVAVSHRSSGTITFDGQTVAVVEPFQGTLSVDGVPYDMTLRVAGSTALRRIVQTVVAAGTEVFVNTRFGVLMDLGSSGATAFEGFGTVSTSLISTPMSEGETFVQGQDVLEADLVGGDGVVELQLLRTTLAIVRR